MTLLIFSIIVITEPAKVFVLLICSVSEGSEMKSIWWSEVPSREITLRLYKPRYIIYRSQYMLIYLTIYGAPDLHSGVGDRDQLP